MDLLMATAIGVLFSGGIFLLLRRNLIRSAIGFLIISYATNLLLLSAGAYSGVAAPYANSKEMVSDPLPQALILTAIVISMGGFSLVMTLIYILSMRYKTSDSDEASKLKN